MTQSEKYAEYLNIIAHPDSMQKVAKLDFLNPDGTIAFSVDNEKNRTTTGFTRTKAWLQSGTLNVSLQNGMRRKASITFDGLDKEFDFSVNHLWFGQQVRLSMGVKLSDGSNFYIPQGVFYISSPQKEWKPNRNQMTYSLVDKWAYLDGSLFGKLNYTHVFDKYDSIFRLMQEILQTSRYTLDSNTVPPKTEMIDCILPVFTDYFNNKEVTTKNDIGEEEVIPMWQVPYELRVDMGETYAKILLELNDLLSAWIGYDATGALRVETDSASDDWLSDKQKPIMWDYSVNSKTFLGLTETSQMGSVYNYLVVIGEALGTNGVKLIEGRFYDPNHPPSSTADLTPLPAFSSTQQGEGYLVVNPTIQDQLDLYYHGKNATAWKTIENWLGRNTTPFVVAQNDDPTSDTAVSRIGRKVQTMSSSGYYTVEQCERLAKFWLKRNAALQQQVTVSSTQMFHFQENNLITVKRSDKQGAPIERHIIQAFSLPITQTGQMSITATSVVDYPQIQVIESGAT